MYGTSYYLPLNDKNRKALKDAYPDFPHNAQEVILEFEGTGTELWNTNATMHLNILYDKENKITNRFTASLNFTNSESYEDLFEKE